MARRSVVSLSGAGAGALYLSSALKVINRMARPDLVSGTSSGAILALWVANRSENVEHGLREFHDLFLRMRDRDVWRWRRLGFACDFLKWLMPDCLRRWLRLRRPGFGLAHFEPLRATIKRIVDLNAVAATAIPIRVVAVDRVTGEPEVFSERSADLIEGVIGSSASQLVQPEFARSGMLMDGGLRHHSPWEVAYAEAQKLWPGDPIDLYIVSTIGKSMPRLADNDWSPGFLRDIEIMTNEVARSDLIIPPLCPSDRVFLVRPEQNLRASGYRLDDRSAVLEAERQGLIDASHMEQIR